MNQLVTAALLDGTKHGLQKVTEHVAMTFLSVVYGTSFSFNFYPICLLVSGRYSILPAISLDGVLHLDIMTKSWNSVEFRQYIEVLLDNMNPFPRRNSVLVMDNASVHHFDGLREIVEAWCKSF